MTSAEYRKLSMLLSNIKNGSRESFSDIYSMYEKKVYFLCCKILKSKSDAKKMTIDVFDYAYMQTANFSNAATFEKWLYNTVFSKCRRFIIDNRPEVLGDYIDSDSPDGEQVDILLVEDADDMMNYTDGIDVTVDIMQTADSILSELPQKLRNVTLLHYFCGFEGEEIASIEQISYAAYKNRLYKARVRLKTEEHKYAEIGYDVTGMVTFFADVLSTMAESIVIPSDIASSVTARTGINCMKNISTVSDDFSDTQATAFVNVPNQKSSNYHATEYGVAAPVKKSFGQDMSPAVKVIMAIVAILIIIGGTVAVVLAVQSHNKSKNEPGIIAEYDNTEESTTLDITTKETTTEETTTEETTAEETTTEAVTETTTEPTTHTTTETTTMPTTEPTTQPADEIEQNEPVGGEDEGNTPADEAV